MGVALRMHPFWEMKDTCVKNSGQNGLRTVQEVLSKDYKSSKPEELLLADHRK